ncbi:MAG TPA: 3-methyl-2-oxobutanoate hydroxymethyltransferase [Polyangia bacterium]|nr:3-methyl-2-oxobutanoate hydroxymethyltransferase [Polyangia bacterium]
MKSRSLPKVTIHTLRKMKAERHKIAMLTAYDASFARLIDQAGVDVILVGDSLGMVVQGGANTLPVTMEEMIYHCRSVARGTERAQVVGDMPFMSYQASLEEGVRNAGRLVKEGGVEAVKLEGGAEYAELAAKLVRIGIPVMGHIGLTPQSLHQMGGFKIQGRDDAQAKKIVDDARALEQAGCYAIVLEGIPRELAGEITQKVACPTIGIGAGVDCDGQVLVIYDLLGMNEEFRPKFVKRYDDLAVRVRTAVAQYVTEVRESQFPDEDHSFSKDAPPANATPYGSIKAAASASGSASERDPDATGAACIPLPIRPIKK